MQREVMGAGLPGSNACFHRVVSLCLKGSSWAYLRDHLPLPVGSPVEITSSGESRPNILLCRRPV